MDVNAITELCFNLGRYFLIGVMIASFMFGLVMYKIYIRHRT